MAPHGYSISSVQAGGLAEDAGNDAIHPAGRERGTRRRGRNAPPDESANRFAAAESFTLDIRKLVETGGDDKANILLYPGDRVTVQRAKLIYILGAVKSPGGYVLNEAHQQITVLKALAMAGDVTNVAKKGQIALLRRDPATLGEKREEIHVNYKAMVKGQIADIRLKPDDIVYVPESGRIKAMRTTVTAAVAMVTMAGPGTNDLPLRVGWRKGIAK